MEFDDLGAHCALPSCNLLDFLPYKCDSCSNTYCHSHYTYEAHNCTSGLHQAKHQSTALICPICSQPIVPSPHENPNQTMALHIDRGCPKRTRSNPQCSHPTCKSRDYAATTCQTCHLTFCVAHRLEADHPCLQNRTSRALATPKQRPTSKHKNTSKIFINTPTTAIGDTQLESGLRINLRVHPPMPLSPRYMYFNKRFTAGRIIDEVISRVKEVPEPGGRRWLLYAVKRNGGGVNLLPHMTRVCELGEFVGDGDDVVLSERENGLEVGVVERVRRIGKKEGGGVGKGRRGRREEKRGEVKRRSKSERLKEIAGSKCVVS